MNAKPHNGTRNKGGPFILAEAPPCPLFYVRAGFCALRLCTASHELTIEQKRNATNQRLSRRVFGLYVYMFPRVRASRLLPDYMSTWATRRLIVWWLCGLLVYYGVQN